MTLPMISIVIPALNAANTIGHQLRALEQQLDDIDCEIVVADNGSTDGTPTTIESWTSRLPLRMVDASARRGPAAARNIGVAATRGQLLLFVDADDVVLPGWLDAWASRADAIVVGGGPVVFFSGENPPQAPDQVPSRLPTHMGFLSYALGANFGVRRDAFDAAGGFPEERTTAEDVVLSWTLQLGGSELTFVRDAVVAKRRAMSTRSTLRQYYRYGLSDPDLYRQFRGAGVQRGPAATTTRSYLGLVARLPVLVDRAQRQRWSAQAGRRAGRIVGSIRTGTRYL
jgi:glycosyltransferase involved in cell wall biosynthesis